MKKTNSTAKSLMALATVASLLSTSLPVFAQESENNLSLVNQLNDGSRFNALPSSLTPAPDHKAHTTEETPSSQTQPKVSDSVATRLSPKFNADDFCGNTGRMPEARIYLENLELKNKKKIDELRQIHNEMAGQDSAQALKEQLIDLRSKYEESVKALSDRKVQKNTQTHDEAQLSNIKTLLRNGLFLHLFSQSLDEKSFQNKDKAPDVDTLCKNNAHFGKSGFCSTSPRFISSFQHRSEKEQINNMLTTMHASFHRIDNPDLERQLENQFKDIANTIPKEIAPEAILGSLTSPDSTLGALLLGDASPRGIIECIRGTEASSCQAFAENLNHNQISNISIALRDDINKFSFGLQQPQITEALLGANLKNKQNIDRLIAQRQSEKTQNQQRIAQSNSSAIQSLTLVNPGQQSNFSLKNFSTPRYYSRGPASASRLSYDLSEDEIQRRINYSTTALSALPLTGNAFLNMPSVEDYKDDVDYQEAINLAVKEALAKNDNYEKKCRDENSPALTTKQGVEDCNNLTDKIIKYYEDKNKEHEEHIKEQFAKAQTILNDPEYKAIELLKEAVIYGASSLCAKDESSPINVTQGDTLCFESRINVSLQNVQAFALNNISITRNLDKSQTQNLLIANIHEYSAACNSIRQTEQDAGIANLCTHLQTLSGQRQEIQVKQDQVAQEDKNFYVEYDSASQRVVRKRKKNMGRIIAEGTLPSVPRILAASLSNYQSYSTINLLKDQALYQKQFLHTQSIYNNNPWMYGMNYFNTSPLYNGTGFMANSPFAGTTIGNSGGFNFGN